MSLWTGCLLDQERRRTGSTASKFSNLLSFLMNCWGMRGFRSLLASFTLCPEKQLYQAQEDWKGRENRNHPHGCPPQRGWEHAVLWEMGSWGQPKCTAGTHISWDGKNMIMIQDKGLLCHPHPCPGLLVSSPGPPSHLVCKVHLHCVILGCGNEGREIKVESGWWQGFWQPWAYHSARQALVVQEEPRRSEKGVGNEPPSETGRQKTPWTVR